MKLSRCTCRMMAQHVVRSSTPAALLLLIFVTSNLVNVNAFTKLKISNNLSVKSVDVFIKKQSYIRENVSTTSGFLIEVLGTGLENNVSLRWSHTFDNCDSENKLSAVWISPNGSRAIYKFVKVPNFKVTTIYFCLKVVGEIWTNLGSNFTIRFPIQSEKYFRMRRANLLGIVNDDPKNLLTEQIHTDVFIEGLRIETSEKDPSYSENGIPEILAGTKTVIRLFGFGFTEDTLITFTDEQAERGTICDKIKSNEFLVKNVRNNTATIDVVLPLGSPFYICVKQPIHEKEGSNLLLFKHQGTETWNTIYTYEKFLPLWLSILIILMCLTFSALFSGLNLGLMAMDRTELKILCNTGTEKEKQYARTIQPVRNHGNYLLCSILFSNVLVNSIFTILLDDLTSGLVAVICSTLAIVIFGEISPQAICSRHGLCIGAKTIYITKLTMIITFPLSYPISKLLDFLLGEEIGNVYNRERLKELVKVTTGYNDLEKDEVNIIAGALELRKKTVADVMTKIEDVYMLDYNAILDFETVSEIMKSGFSRIPVYENARTNIVTMLYIKDLAFVDPDDNMPLKTLCQFYQNPCNFIFEDVTLDIMFKQFKEGHKGHMAFVQRVNNEGEGDPFYEVIGLVTLEDVIEELIQAEIMDETDVFTDNKSKRRRQARHKIQDFTVFAEKKENQRIHISPQLTLAMFQYLSTTVDAFKPDTISETILRRLLKQDIIYHIKVKSREKARNDPAAVIYQQGKAVDYFVLILEGRVEVTVGKENMMFESGPFTYFGSQALTVNIGIAESPTNTNPQTVGSIQSINLDSMLRYTFIPDYTVRAVSEVFYVKIKRSLYLAAKRATLLERSQKDSLPGQEQFDDEVEKLLHSLDEDDRSMPESPVLPVEKEKESKKEKEKEKDNVQSPVYSATAPTSPAPVSASPVTHSKFISSYSDHNGKLKNSPTAVISFGQAQPKLDLNTEILARQEANRTISTKKLIDDEERTNLLPKQEDS
ncbi:metal transporter CNNM4 isoform X2 [Apis mellifera]|uniref:Metal transporter CNNM4 isoform X2 n=1 Tax=Apis mellifera TaxID=7460 RepID=A0A7M7MUN6_APIME|nr:metal transporter CNNM4 isoform X2 [Apis mellifera]|eukprot:XP_026301243.1 metal transporter CNNM4 isoform X2 [Apis mellifera]